MTKMVAKGRSDRLVKILVGSRGCSGSGFRSDLMNLQSKRGLENTRAKLKLREDWLRDLGG
jgi:hypothetical protein